MRSHDLTGAVFQKLISDRKFLAAYYTTPASAYTTPASTALMAGLILPESDPLPGGAWGMDKHLTSLRIADFACGTGTLLSTVYQRLGQIHELYGGNSEAIHREMMGDVLFDFFKLGHSPDISRPAEFANSACVGKLFATLFRGKAT